MGCKFYDKDGNEIKIYNKDHEQVAVISTVQVTHEWAVEFGRAERLRKCCIAELITIVLLSIALLRKGELWEQ